MTSVLDPPKADPAADFAPTECDTTPNVDGERLHPNFVEGVLTVEQGSINGYELSYNPDTHSFHMSDPDSDESDYTFPATNRGWTSMVVFAVTQPACHHRPEERLY